MENKKTRIISIISIVVLALILISATFAYFVAQTGEGSQTDIRINANTVDTFTFETGSALSLNLNQENFAEGNGNQTGTTFAKAMLSANNKTNSVTEHYYLYLNIFENTFIYAKSEDTPEILLTIKDASGNEITNVNGLTYKTVTDGNGTTLNGFDITTKSGLLTIFDNREITTTSSITEEWNIVITFVNYEFNQSVNAGKSFNGKILIQKENFSLANYVLSQYTGTQGDNNLYYHGSTLANGAKDNSYRYSGGDYQLTSKAITAGLKYVMPSSISSTDGVINMYCNDIKRYVGYTCSSIKYYALQYDTTNTHYETYYKALEKAIADGYVTKDNVKNFVCFGSDASICPEDNLYRIIGVFDGKVKLIKYDYASSALLGTDGDYIKVGTTPKNYTGYMGNLINIDTYDWNYNATSSATNTWSTSLLNKTNLNTNFLNNIGSNWANKIAITTWKVGGNKYNNIVNVVPSVMYQNEIIKANATECSAKVGLMYVSDYSFAVASSVWSSLMSVYVSNTATKSNNWMYMGYNEWTITRDIDASDNAFIIMSIGNIYNNSVDGNFAIRPVFFLNDTVNYTGGLGTISNPIRIS